METGPIKAIVFEGISNSGYKWKPMRMRASYPPDTKRATLVHELAHRLIADLSSWNLEEHPIIFLFVYDVWVKLWGQEFADEQVAVESERPRTSTTTNPPGATPWRLAPKGGRSAGRSSSPRRDPRGRSP